MNKIWFKDRIKEWEGLLRKIIRENIPRTTKVNGVGLSPPMGNNPEKMISYFLKGHRPKMLKSLELLDNYVNKGGLALSAGSWISAMGLFFYLKCGMKSESISIDCDDWELSGVTKNTRKNLCFVESLGKEKYDLVIEAEMFGHYPGSEAKCAKMIIDSCKKGGIVHFSVPLGGIGINISKYEPFPTAKLDVNGSYDLHLRQYQEDEIIKMIKDIAPECELLENEIVITPAFGKIQITIWRKK